MDSRRVKIMDSKLAARIALKVAGILLNHINERGMAVRVDGECFAVFLRGDMIHIEETEDIEDGKSYAFLDLIDQFEIQ